MINLIPFKQFISAGHHDNDPGAVANGYQENELTKDLRNRILKYGNSKEIIVDNGAAIPIWNNVTFGILENNKVKGILPTKAATKLCTIVKTVLS